MNARLKALKKAILERYKTPYAFWRANPDIKRSTLYMVLAGKYPGDIEKHLKKYEALLNGEVEKVQKHITVNEHDLNEVLQEHKCLHCRLLNMRQCAECKTQTMKEANAVYAFILGEKR